MWSGLPRPQLSDPTHLRAVLAEQLDDCAERRRYRLDVLARSRIALINDCTTEEQNPTPAAPTAQSAATGSRGGPFIHHDGGLDPSSHRRDFWPFFSDQAWRILE